MGVVCSQEEATQKRRGGQRVTEENRRQIEYERPGGVERTTGNGECCANDSESDRFPQNNNNRVRTRTLVLVLHLRQQETCGRPYLPVP